MRKAGLPTRQEREDMEKRLRGLGEHLFDSLGTDDLSTNIADAEADEEESDREWTLEEMIEHPNNVIVLSIDLTRTPMSRLLFFTNFKLAAYSLFIEPNPVRTADVKWTKKEMTKTDCETLQSHTSGVAFNGNLCSFRVDNQVGAVTDKALAGKSTWKMDHMEYTLTRDLKKD